MQLERMPRWIHTGRTEVQVKDVLTSKRKLIDGKDLVSDDRKDIDI